MQPHSEVPTTTKKASATTTNSVSPKTTTTAASSKDIKINNQSPSLCKLVKGRRPLVNFNFYLDIKDHQISKKVEERIIELGGNLEFFLTKSVTHFITDRSLPAAPSGSQTATGHGQGQSHSNHNNNGHCLNSPSTGVGVNGGGVGGGGGGGVYPITPSPYLQSPQTPTTPKTPYTNQTYSGDSATDGVGSSHSRIKGASTTNNTPNNKKKISRADAMLHRALQSQQQSQHYTANQQPEEQKRPNLEDGAYRIWSLEYAIRFLKKVTADVKQYAKKAQQPTKGACEPIQLKGHFIKIEAISGSHRPYYSVFRNIEWPKIQLGGEAGAFRLTPKREPSKSAKDKPSKTNAMTRKSRSSSKHNPNHMRLKAKQAPKQATEKPAAVIDNSSEKQCGVCEICKIEYDTLTIHLKTKDHEFFARNQNNYLALDSLIKSSASVDKFLEDTSKDEAKEESEEPMEIEEESTRSTRKSSRKQSPPPPVQVSQPAPPAAALKIKTKLKEVEVVTEKKNSHNNAKKSSAKLNLPLDSPPIRHPLPTSTIYKVVADSKAQTDPVSPKKSSIIVKFRKIRQTELSILNGEAENFMFPRRPTSSDRATDSDRQTSTDSNRISSSSISSESHLTEEPQVPDRPDSAAAKRRRTADNSHKANATATAAATSVCYQSFPNTPIQPNKTSQPTSRDTPDTNRTGCVTTKPPATTTQRKRRCVGSGRKRRATSRSSRNRRNQRWDSEDRMGEEGNSEYDDDEELRKILDSNSMENDDSPRKSPKVKKVRKSVAAFDLNQGRLKEQTYAFERLPVKELWFEVFRRQDACQERMFEYWGSTSYRKLPYEIGAIPVRQLPNCKICTPHQMVEVKQEPVTKPTTKRMAKLKKVKKERQSKSKSNTPEPAAASSMMKASKNSSKAPPHNKHLNKATFLSCDLMPRKSPREHASTLAILSCLIKQRKDSEIDEKPPASPPKEKTPEKSKTPSPVPFTPRNETPEPLQFVSEISENVKRLRRGQRKFDDFIPTTTPLSPKSNKKKPAKPKAGGLEFEVDEKRLKSLEVKQKSALELEQEIDAYLGRISMKSLRLTPTLPVQESSSSSGFVDDFTSDVDLIDLIDCYDGGGGGGEGNDNSNDLYRPAINTVYNLFSAHTRRRKTNKANKTGWPTTRRRNAANTRQNHLLQKSERFRFFSDYQTRQSNSRGQEGHLLGPPTTATSMTPPDTDLDDKDDCTRSSVPDGDEMEEEEVSVMCKEDILNNSCMSPSEKADNSDIFTVSSDGLDTDLDVSCNQIIKTEEIDVDDECTTSSTLAAPPPPPPRPPPPVVVEAPTPAPDPIEKVVKVKTPPSGKNHLTIAMRSIIKREVKVTCKRLRTPFRRFRQKR